MRVVQFHVDISRSDDLKDLHADINSTNGTKLNDMKLPTQALLTHAKLCCLDRTSSHTCVNQHRICFKQHEQGEVKHQRARRLSNPVSNFISNLTARVFTSLIDHRQINNYDEKNEAQYAEHKLGTSRNNNNSIHQFPNIYHDGVAFLPLVQLRL